MSTLIRAGLIGAGGMANRVHYPSLALFPDVELAGLCDLVPEKARQTAERFRVDHVYHDYRQMLDEREIDAVWILMPPHQLFDVVIDCARRKKHVFIEKPPGITYEQARMMARECEANGVKGMCGFNRRYIPLLRECRRRVEARGAVIHAVATFYKHHLEGPAYYQGAADILTCDAIHAVDLLRWLGGEPRHVAATIDRRFNPFDDAFNALIRFEEGASGVLLGNWSAGARRHTFEIHGPGISAFVDPDHQASIYADGRLEPEIIDSREIAGSDDFRVYYGFEAENRHFIDCIRGGTEPESSLADAARTMRLVQEIYANPLDPGTGRWAGR